MSYPFEIPKEVERVEYHLRLHRVEKKITHCEILFTHDGNALDFSLPVPPQSEALEGYGKMVPLMLGHMQDSLHHLGLKNRWVILIPCLGVVLIPDHKLLVFAHLP